MAKLEVSTRILDEGRGEIQIAGSLDAETYEEAERAFQELFGQNRHRLIVLLDRVNYISSAGAGVLIGALTQARQHGGNVVLVNPSKPLHDVFDLLGVLEVFPVVPDVAAAVALLDAPQ